MTEGETAAPAVAETPDTKLFGKWTITNDDVQISDISLQDSTNPLQVLVNAVDVSPLHRVHQTTWLLCTGTLEGALREIKTIAECLADELITATKGSSNSFAIKKKDELERVAKSNYGFSQLMPNKPVCALG
uniref:Small ribosomal subunit protein uS7 domain-containing protein n=1 Tax=Nomascus leucogenys TaxID=61853 RepID=A0A2I3GZY0_NOMLE